MRKILVTGSAGFIGYHLTKQLLERGDVVVGIDNLNNYYDVHLKYSRLAELGIGYEAKIWNSKIQSNEYPNHSFFRLDIENSEQVNQLFYNEHFDVVCNLAAQAGVRYSIENPYAYISSNIIGFFNVLEACKNNSIKHLIYASSSSVYGNNTKMPLSTADNVDHPISLYATTKKSNELMAHTYSHLYGIRTTGLRFFTVYGPWGRPDMALFLFTKAILDNKPIKIFNYGNMYRDFTYIDDIIKGILLIIDSSLEEKSTDKTFNVPYKIYNIGNSQPVLLTKFITALENSLDKTALKEYLPIQPGDVLRTEADITDLVEDFGYKPCTPINEGIDKFINWYKEYYL